MLDAEKEGGEGGKEEQAGCEIMYVAAQKGPCSVGVSVRMRAKRKAKATPSIALTD